MSLFQYLSTSPEQEPSYFEVNVRKALKVLSDHPHPEQTLFPDGQPHRYYLQQDGRWTLVVEDDVS
jgi:protein N-terminal asparagine amidohydrolase